MKSLNHKKELEENHHHKEGTYVNKEMWLMLNESNLKRSLKSRQKKGRLLERKPKESVLKNQGLHLIDLLWIKIYYYP